MCPPTWRSGTCATWRRPGAWRRKWTQARGRNSFHAVYARIDVAGPDFRAVHLTPTAYRYGLDQALPQSVSGVLWRPRQDSNLRPAA